MENIIIFQNENELTDFFQDFLLTNAEEYNIFLIKNSQEFSELFFKKIIPDLIILDFETQRATKYNFFIHLKINEIYRNIPILFSINDNSKVNLKMGRFLGDKSIYKTEHIKTINETIKQLIAEKKAK